MDRQLFTHHFQYIIPTVFSFIDISIINYRLLKIFFTLGSLVILSYGLSIWLVSHKPSYGFKKIFSTLLLVGSFGSFISLYPRAISYNDLTTFNGMVSTGILLILFSKYSVPSQGRSIFPELLVFIVGFLLGIQFLVKFTTGLLMIIASMLFYYFMLRDKNKAQLIFSGFIYVLGILTAVFLFILMYGNVGEWIENIEVGFRMASFIGQNDNQQEQSQRK